MVLAVQNIAKSYDGEEILKRADFHIEDGEKTAIVGINGAGKTTLLKIITGEETSDSGQVIVARDKRLGYLAQYQKASDDMTLFEMVLEGKRRLINMENRLRVLEQEMQNRSDMPAVMDEYHTLLTSFRAEGGEYYESMARGVILGLGFSREDFDKKLGTFSGGQKTRAAMCRLLCEGPDILLLDEPTNHLDVDSVVFLEGFLRDYKGAVLLVSHDRFFLNQVVSRVVEIDHHVTTVYEGNYDRYSEKKEKARADQMKAYLNNRRQIEHEEEVIAKLRSFNREKSIRRAESRQKRLDKMERVEQAGREPESFTLRLEPSIESGNDVLSVEHLAKRYGEKALFADLSFEVKKGERVALIGDNGTGKTTILKIINRLTAADNGQIRLGSNVHIGYYDQEQQLLEDDVTLFDALSDAYPEMTNSRIRSHLAAFLFTGDDVFKKVGALSGGERGRLSLAKLMLSEANFLILDEPTNHLDILSEEVLEQALCSYTGTVLFVSHDRYFINKCATRVLELAEGTLHGYLGNYDYYLSKKKAVPQPEESAREMPRQTQAKRSWEESKRLSAEKKKRERRLLEVEREIEALENKKNELGEMSANADIAANSVRLQEIYRQITDIDEKLHILYDEWEELA